MPQNPRIVSPDALAALERSMDKYGDLGGIVFNRRSGHLIAGHQRLKHFDPAADVVIAERHAKPTRQGTVAVGHVVRAGERWPYREVDVDEPTELAMNVRANIAAGVFEKKGLAAIVQGLRDTGTDLATMGLDPAAVAALLGRGETSPVQEPPPLTPPTRPRSQKGKIYELGAHRLACGDNRDAALIRTLLKDVAPALVFTDPPYGVSYQGGKPIAGDQLRRDALAQLIAAAFRLALSYVQDTAAWYVWHASESRRDFDQALAAVGLQERQYLIWVKSGLVLGHADYQWAHEPCYYAAKAGEAPAYYGDRQQATVWRFAAVTPSGALQVVVGPGLLLSDGRGAQLFLVQQPPKQKKVRHLLLEPGETLYLTGGSSEETVWEAGREHAPQHPTQKPVALAHRAISNSTRAGEWVYDCYAGSGNTLLAAELTGRKAALVELDPAYCDVIRQRYADLVQDAQWSPTRKLTPKRADAARNGGPA